MTTVAPPLPRTIEVNWLAQLRPGDLILRIDEHRYRPELTVLASLTALDSQGEDRGVRCAPVVGGGEVIVRPVECSRSLTIVREDAPTTQRAPSAGEGAHRVNTTSQKDVERRASTSGSRPAYRPHLYEERAS